jgi:hypothetical protein
MRNKQGFSHIEVILSFVIFVGFLIFAYFFFSPFETGRTLKSSIDYTQREISDYVKAELESYSVAIDPSVPLGVIGVNIARPSNDHNAKVILSDGTLVNYLITTGTSGDIIYFNKPFDNYVKIVYGYDFLPGTERSSMILDKDKYQISSSDSLKVYTENNFTKLKNEYETDYLGLKTNFNVPNRVDFGFTLKLKDNSELIAEKEIPSNLEVITHVDRIEIIRSISGDLEYADLITKVW